MRRSILIVCALGIAIPLGTLVSQAENSPRKSADAKTPATEMKKTKPPETPVRRTGVAAIEAALEQRIPCEFVDMPLKDVIEYLRDAAKIEIWLDESGLKDAGVDPETLVTFGLRDCRLVNTLDMILDKLKLAWTFHDDVLWITSPENAESGALQETRLYDVADLVVYQDEKGARFDDYSPLTYLIINAVETKSWVDNGGSGSIDGVSLGTAKVLVVSQPYKVHKQIASLLEQIRAIAAKRSGDGLPHRSRPQAAQHGSVATGETGVTRDGKPQPKSAVTPAAK